MAFVPGTLVVADETLNRAVSNALNRPFYVQMPKKQPRYLRNALNEKTPAAENTPTPVPPEDKGYQGYFTIVDASEEGEGGVVVPKVKVWDPRTLFQSQPCYVNTYRKGFAAWTSPALSGTVAIVCIHYHAATPSSGTVGTPSYQAGTEATLELEIRNIEPSSDTATDVWYQIGRVFLEDGKITQILQDHVSGIVRMMWLSACGT